jgi:hypothetical protein
MNWTPRTCASLSVSLAALAIGLLPAGRADGQSSSATPALVFSDQTIQAVGMTAGGKVIWFGIGREVREYAETLSEHQEVMVADAKGQSILTVAPAVPRQSLWIAVDLTTGLFALAAPPAFPVRRFDLEPAAVSVGGGSAGDQILDSSDTIEVLLVRPGQGAWSKNVWRGSADDLASPGAAHLAFSVSALLPVQAGGAASPAKVNAGDLLFVAHPRAMEIGSALIGVRP